jgi:ATP-binding cassette subfamily C protein
MISGQTAFAGKPVNCRALITTSISGFGLLFTAFLVSGPLVIFCLVATLALALPLYYILKLAQESSQRQWATSNDLSSGVQDVLSNMKPLKSMARQGYFLHSFADSIRKLRVALILMVVTRHAIYHGQDILGAIMVIAGVYVGVVVLNTPLAEMLVVGIIFYQVIDVVKRIHCTCRCHGGLSRLLQLMKVIEISDNQGGGFGKADRNWMRVSGLRT